MTTIDSLQHSEVYSAHNNKQEPKEGTKGSLSGRVIKKLDPSENPIEIIDIIYCIWNGFITCFYFFISEEKNAYHAQLSIFHGTRFISKLGYHLDFNLKPHLLFQTMNFAKPYLIEAPTDRDAKIKENFSEFGENMADLQSERFFSDIKKNPRRYFSGVCAGATYLFLQKYIKYRKTLSLEKTLDKLGDKFSDHMPKKAYTIQRFMDRENGLTSISINHRITTYLGLNRQVSIQTKTTNIKEIEKKVKLLPIGSYDLSIKDKRTKKGHAVAIIKDISGKTFLFDSNLGLAEINKDSKAQVYKHLDTVFSNSKYILTPVTALEFPN